MKKLSDSFFVAPQISLEDITEAASAGVTTIIMNRPEGEEAGQISVAELKAAAAAVGISFHHIPVRPGEITEEAVLNMAKVLAAAEGKTLAFCKTGARSSALWALGEAGRGVDADSLLATIQQQAGFDLSTLRPALEALAKDA